MDTNGFPERPEDARMAGDVRRLARGKILAAAFAPNGRHVAVIFQQDVDHCYLYVLDLPDPQ